MTSRSTSQDARSTQDAKRRKRRERPAKAPVPEPKDIVSGAGRPLDPSVRRELEERLGHDLGRVRLHTDRDAGALTELLGADAVAVGRDVLFREGAYRPHTAEGMRLLAHELLHTVQNPEGLGALRAGRDLGAVSLPQQAVEREAETAAQESVREDGPGTAAERVEEGRATPGWLRYATVDADRRRMEQLDPATLVDRLANGVLRSLRGDPEDRSKRVRLQLARMAPGVQDAVLDRLEVRLPSPTLDRLLDLVEEAEEGPLPPKAATTPETVPDEAEDIAREREREPAGEQRDTRERAEGGGDGREQPGRQEERGKPAEGGAQRGGPAAPGDRGETARDGNDSASPRRAAVRDRQEASARQQDRSQNRQEDRSASAREDARRGEEAAEERAEAEGPEDETSREPETRVAEQAPRKSQDPGEEGAAGREAAAAPAAVDRSGAEPGEKARTGGGLPTARSVGDPENEEDADDEPLGLETESAESDAGEERDEEAGSRESTPGTDLLGPDEYGDDPGLFVQRRRGEPRPPGLSFSDAEPVRDEAEPSGSESASPRSEEDESESRVVQSLLDDAADERGLGPEGGGEAHDTAPWHHGPAGVSLTDPAETTREKKQAEDRKEDAEARRRDEEARAADAAAGGAAPEPGETAAPGQLDKAGEDARRQQAGTSSSGSAPSGGAAAAEGGGRTDGTGETARPGGADAAGSRETGTGTSAREGTDKADDDTAPSGNRAEQDFPATAPGGQGVTEGRGPATSAGPRTGPDRVSAPGPAEAPQLEPGNGPSPKPAGPEARDNAPKPAETPGSAPRPKPKGTGRQTTRRGAGSARRGGGGRPAPAPAPARSGGRTMTSGPVKPKETPAPDVSNATPESGLATAAGLKPHQALETLKGVDGAVGRSVDKERAALRKAPPTIQRPSGSPRTVPGGPKAAAPGTYTNVKVARTEAARGRTPEITGERRPEGDLPGASMPEPSWWDIAVTIGAQLVGKLLKEILPLDDLIDSILQIPTRDEGLRGARVGDAPRLPLQDDSDPQRTDEQSGKLDERKNELHRSGREDAARPMGEDQIYPDVPGETLTGKVPGGRKAAGAGGTRTVSGGVPIESASAVAEHDRGPQIRAGFAEGRQKMTQERQAKDEKAAEDRRKHDQDLQREVSASSRKQAAARDKGRADIAESRDRWRKEQDDKVAEIDDKKGKKYDRVRKDIKEKEEQTDKDVDKRTEDDNKRIEDEQTNAEREAEKKQENGKDDADNWLEEAIEKLKQFFEDLKNAIKSVFEKARQAVTDIIDKFKQQVFKLIDDARNWVIDKINQFADALIALGDELLADYPAMRDKWRNTIDGARDWAVQKVNEAADALKETVGRLLDGLCGALLAGLDLLETGLLAAVDIAETVTVGALEFGASVVQGLGEWAAIFNDIVSDPGDWIGKAGDAAEAGARDHLFDEIKTAVRAWFNQKVQEIIGIPPEDFQELLDGGVTVEQMAQMAWDEALPRMPFIIGVLVVQKVVAKLIPGVGWVMAIIDALQTAWGALSEILAAFGLFMDFLKSVKSGNGALPFAKAVAAGVVALLELVYQFLIEGVGRFMGKVADDLGNMLRDIRKRKDRPGQPGRPGTPGRPKDSEPRGSESSTADKSADHPAPRKLSPDKASRPRPNPRPGKRSAPEKKPRPSHTTRPKKRRDDEERREEGREVSAARRRMRDAERRMRDGDREERAERPSRRGPARSTLRTDRNRPGADRTDDRDSRSPGRDEERRTTERRPDDTRRSGRRRDTDDGNRQRRRVRRARQTVKSALNRTRRAAHRLHGKARRRIGGRLNDRLRRLRDLWRRSRDRLQDGRSRRSDRGRRDTGTESIDLPRVRFADADDGDLHTLLFHGRGADALLYLHSTPEEIPAFLDDWRTDLEQQEPSPEKENQEVYLKAAAGRYNRIRRIQKGIPAQVRKADRDKYKPHRQAIRRRMKEFAYVARLRQYDDVPEPKFQDFYDVSPGRSAAVQLSEYLGASAKTVFGGKGQDADRAKKGQPPGWDYITKKGLSEKSAWVRMHLLPERIGGKATGSNLVPARGPQTNIPFRQNIEDQAYRSVPGQKKIIWYKTEVRFGYSRLNEVADFPSYIYAAYGGYEKVRGTGKRRSDWVREGPEKQYHRNVDPPRQDEGGILFINLAGRATIASMLECSERLARHVVDAREDAGKFDQVQGIKKTLRDWRKRKGKGNNFMPGLEEMLVRLDRLIAHKKVDLSV